MNLWKRDEPKIDEKSWLFDSSSSLSTLSTIPKQNPSAYGTCRDGMLNDQEVDKGRGTKKKGGVNNGDKKRSQLLLTVQPTIRIKQTNDQQHKIEKLNSVPFDIKKTQLKMTGINNNQQEVAESQTKNKREQQQNMENERTESICTEEEALDYMVAIPETDGESIFSLRKLWAFTGPGFLMSIAYLDPGNIESDLQSGTVARYKLLWVLLMAHILGFFLQRLSARLGVVSGKNMAEMAYEFYPKVPRLFLWSMIEIAIICSDMQEVIGTAIAFSLLSNGRIPLFVGVLITMVDTFTFLLIDRYGFRKLEFIFALLIATMAITFGFEFFVVKPDIVDLISGTLLPYCPDCGRKEFLQAISVVGAVIMPHNLYLHSALVKSRKIDRSQRRNISEANLYYFIECVIALTCSFFINLFVVSVFAHGLYGKTNADIFKSCEGQSTIPDRQLFPNNTDPVEADIYKGGIFLGCQFGLTALYVWGVGIMAAGQSSTMTGTYAGQFTMEGFLQIKWPRWRRVLFTRSIAIVPTLSLALKTQGVQNLTGMNDLLNCVQMIQLPFALLPIITFTAHRKIMFDFCTTLTGQVFAFFTSLLVIAINLYFSFDYIMAELEGTWMAWIMLIGPGSIYITFVLYLIITCLQSMSLLSLNIFDSIPFLKREDTQFTISAPWVKITNFSEQIGSSRDPIDATSSQTFR
uniref:Uncharacterized protein n=3 Tax=Meloidogyne TaxID=189290 RepID=A0A914KLT1_MELIC